jgi:hypothetical protein
VEVARATPVLKSPKVGPDTRSSNQNGSFRLTPNTRIRGLVESLPGCGSCINFSNMEQAQRTLADASYKLDKHTSLRRLQHVYIPPLLYDPSTPGRPQNHCRLIVRGLKGFRSRSSGATPPPFRDPGPRPPLADRDALSQVEVCRLLAFATFLLDKRFSLFVGLTSRTASVTLLDDGQGGELEN